MVFQSIRKTSLAWLAVLALGAAACSSADTVATVNGEPITRADLEALNVGYRDAPLAPGEQMRQDVTQLVIAKAAATAAEQQFGITFSEADVDDRIASPPTRYAGLFAADADSAQARTDATQTLIRDAVVTRLVNDQFGGVAGYVAENPEDVVQVCVRHIMSATPEESAAVLARLEAGESFDDVMVEVSLDTSTPNGLLTINGRCPIHVGVVGEEFAVAVATAPIGEPTGPVASDAGFFHIIVVEDRTQPDGTSSDEEFLDQLDGAAAAALFSPWVNEALRTAEVDVASEIGTWSSTGLGIAPPGTDVSGG